MRILITGVTGFIGSHLGRYLRDLPDVDVHGLAAHAEPPSHLGVPVVNADVTDQGALVSVIERLEPDAIIHLAGLSHVGESWKRPGDYLQVNFGGTRNLVHAAAGRTVVFASSAEVYGNVAESEQPIREERPLDPRSPYAMTKACAEQVALDHGAIVVRSFNTIGPGQGRHFALPSFASQLAAIQRGDQEAVIHVGDLSPRRDFLHVADAVRGYEAVLRRGERGHVYNLASGKAHSIQEALDALRRISGVEAQVERDPARVRPVDVPLLSGDIRSIGELGWTPELSFEDALADLWRDILEHPEGEAI
ncbi:MAG: GDP-mannose 4,6-dehydratase [Acidobacteriota bacterium]